MGIMKKLLQEKIENNMELISNHMDNDAIGFIQQQVEEANNMVYKAMETFAIVKATLDEIENTIQPNIYEDCCNESECGEDFQEWFERLEKIEDIYD